MMKYINIFIILSCVFCGAMFISSCDNSDNEEVRYMLPPATTIQMTAEQKAMVLKSNDFSFNLFREVYRQRQAEGKGQKSMFFSPMGVTFMMGMLAEGAEGETQREILKTMCLDDATAREISQMCEVLIDDAPEADRQVTLEIANAIYTNKGYEPKKEYKECMDEYYDADVRSLDFSNAESLNAINNWAKDETNGKIQKVIDRLSSDAVAYILNTIYFEAKWTNQFDSKNTKSEAFYTETGQTKEIPMMSNTALAVCGSDVHYDMLRLPYGSGTVWNMYVLMPKEGQTVNDVIASLDGPAWKEAVLFGETKEVKIKLPRFTTTDRTDLIAPLQALGTKKLFAWDEAELSKICSTNMFISEAYQNASIEVNEEGAKMSAVTVSQGDLGDMGGYRKDEFYANRPFVYIVTENNTQAIFFAGVYNGD